MKQPAIYIMANERNGTLYTGVTSNLIQRDYHHKNKTYNGFSGKHDCNMLVYYEIHGSMEEAIKREKRIKGGSRLKKLKLIESINPNGKIYRKK